MKTKINQNFTPIEPYIKDKKEVETFKLFINIIKNMRLIFKTDLRIKELFGLKKFKRFFDKITKCHFILEKIKFDFKLYIMNIKENYYCFLK